MESSDDPLRWLIEHPIDEVRLRAFVVVAEKGSFTAAARGMFTSQPWVSTQVRELEARVGAPLLHRGPGRVTCTPAGAAVLPLARRLLERSALLAEAFHEPETEGRATLRVGAPGYTFDFPTRARTLERFRATHPDRPVEIVGGTTGELLDALRAHRCDVAFALLPVDADVQSRPLEDSALWLRVPDAHPLAGRATLELRDLAGVTLASFDRRLNPALYDRVHEPLVAVGAELETLPGLRVQGVGEVAVHRGLPAVATCGRRGVPPAIEGSTVRRVEGLGVLTLGIVRRPDDDTEAVEAFWRTAITVAGERRIVSRGRGLHPAE
jgi:DNA-binding transcriptional LysR family regulator